MTITEFATLRLTQSPPHTFSSPTLLPLFTRLAQLQGAYSSHPLLYFQHNDSSSESKNSDNSTNGKDENTIYLISGWESVKKHEEWIASEENQEFLRGLASFVGIEGLVHVGVDFGGLEEEMEDVFGIEIIVRDAQAGTDAALKDGTGDVKAIWEGSGGDMEGKSGRRLFEFRAYDENGWKVVTSKNLEEENGRDRTQVGVSIERAMRLHVGPSN